MVRPPQRLATGERRPSRPTRRPTRPLSIRAIRRRTLRPSTERASSMLAPMRPRSSTAGARRARRIASIPRTTNRVHREGSGGFPWLVSLRPASQACASGSAVPELLDATASSPSSATRPATGKIRALRAAARLARTAPAQVSAPLARRNARTTPSPPARAPDSGARPRRATAKRAREALASARAHRVQSSARAMASRPADPPATGSLPWPARAKPASTPLAPVTAPRAP